MMAEVPDNSDIFVMLVRLFFSRGEGGAKYVVLASFSPVVAVASDLFLLRAAVVTHIICSSQSGGPLCACQQK